MFWLKRLLLALGALVLLAGIVLAALVLLVNPNDYKATLVDLVRDRYDRTLVIDGDIRLSFMPRLGLEIGGVSLSEPHSNQVFAAVDSARAAVAFWPLFSRHVVIEQLSLVGVKANMVRDAEGRFNFDDLLRAPPPDHVPAAPAEDASGDGSLQLAVGSVNVSGGDIALRDEGNDMALRLERLNVAATGIATGKAFEISAAARLLGQSPRVDATMQAQGRLGIEGDTPVYTLRGLDVRMAGMLPSVKTNAFNVRGDVTYDPQAQVLALANAGLAFQGDIAFATPLVGVEAQLAAARFLVALDGQRLDVEGLTGKAQGRMGVAPFGAALDVPRLALAEDNASGGPLQASLTLEGDEAFSVRAQLDEVSGKAASLAVARAEIKASLRRQGRTAALDLTSPMTADVRAGTVALSALDATARIEGQGMPDGGLVVPATGRLAADAQAGSADARLEVRLPAGTVSVAAKAAQLHDAVPRVDLDLKAAALDLDTLWPRLPAPAPVPASAAPPRPADAPVPETPVDLSPLQQLQGGLAARIDRLTWRGVQAQGVQADLRLADGKADLDLRTERVFEGRLAGKASADAGTQRLSSSGQWTSVAVAPLLQAVMQDDPVSGRGDLRWTLAATGKTVEALRRGLGGEVGLTVRDGAVRGFDIARSLRDFRTLIGRGEPATSTADRSRSTDFSELRATLDIAEGVGTLRQLDVSAPLLRVAVGKPATVDLVAETLDIQLDTRVVNTATGQDGKALEALRGVTVPIRVSGPWAAPETAVQWNRVAARTLSEAVEREAGRQLERLLGGRRDGDAPAAPDASTNPAGRILGDALKGLFNP